MVVCVTFGLSYLGRVEHLSPGGKGAERGINPRILGSACVIIPHQALIRAEGEGGGRSRIFGSRLI